MTLKNKHHGKGNVREQKRRRRKRLKERPPKLKEKVQLIDGNWTLYPVAYCKSHGGYLTQGLIETHRCVKRKCSGLGKVIDYEEN